MATMIVRQVGRVKKDYAEQIKAAALADPTKPSVEEVKTRMNVNVVDFSDGATKNTRLTAIANQLKSDLLSLADAFDEKSKMPCKGVLTESIRNEVQGEPDKQGNYGFPVYDLLNAILASWQGKLELARLRKEGKIPVATGIAADDDGAEDADTEDID